MAVNVSSIIDPSLVNDAIMVVAYRGPSQLASETATLVLLPSGVLIAHAQLDLRAAGEGHVSVAFLDDSCTPVAVVSDFEITDAGVPLTAASLTAGQEDLATAQEATDTLITGLGTRIPDALVNGNLKANVIAVSGDSVAADNMEKFFDGTGYGIHGMHLQINSVTSTTIYECDYPLEGFDDDQFNDCTALFIDGSTGERSFRKIIDSSREGGGGDTCGITIDSAPTFTVTDSDSVFILPPGFMAPDAAAIPTAIENADALLDRNMATGTDSGSPTVRTVRQALRASRNRQSIVAGVLTVYKEDDATAAFTMDVTATVGASPITALDPTGP
jgi:hypothetical protein